MEPDDGTSVKQRVLLIPDNPAVASVESVEALEGALADFKDMNERHGKRLTEIENELAKPRK